LIGHAAPDGEGLDGIELSLDSLLRGVPGHMAAVRDGRRNQLRSPERQSVAPIPGHTVELTIRLDLQDISERALGEAVQRTGAHGGDIVVLDPRSGEILALASQRRDVNATAATALTEPVEPGSTLKPFVAAALLARGRVQLDEEFNTYNGEYKMFGFKITDEHKAPQMTFKEVIEYSSNIGMAQAAMRLTPREEYEALRDFGFGTPTGLPFPSEAGGHLAEPKHWSALSQASLARGYEINVTPVQLAVAYGAIANGGELLQPAIIKQIRDSRGAVVYQHEREVVRRAISRPVASQVRALLRSVVDSGTAMKADLAMYEVGGKSGTARRTGADGKYIPNDYTATFVGLFPADEPQLVVLVKLDSPSGAAYYGGQIAAPVTKAVLQAALASSDAVLDRSKLRPRARTQAQFAALTAARDTAADDEDLDNHVQFVLNPLHPAASAPVVSGPRPVPDVRGMSVRGAAAALHRAGFRVRLERGNDNTTTVPAAGTVARAGTLVRLQRGL
jgi:cell division protein FtsI (penicillin-binding protein 3)